jgi:hypothetical protein
MKRFSDYLEQNPWACAVLLALCIVAVGAIEAHPTFPYNLFPG